MQTTFSRSKRKRSRWETSAPFIASGAGLVLVALLVPSNPARKTEPRIFTEGISVQIDRSSPAFAALEDTLAERDIVVEAEPSRVALVAGEASLEPISTAIVQANDLEEKLIAEERAQQRQTMEVVKAVASRVFTLPDVNQPSFGVAIVNDAPAKKAAATEKPIEHPVQILSLGSLKMNREQLAKSLIAPIVDVARTPAPRVASVPRPAPVEDWSPASTTVASNDRGFLGAGKTAHGLVKSDSAENANVNVRQVVISGQLEFSGGVALTSSNDRVVVYREEDNEVLEPGAVWIREGRYEIFVEQPVGQLVAELRAANGEIMARGTYDLDALPALKAQQYRVEAIAIKMGPVPHGIIGRVVAPKIGKADAQPLMNTQVQLEQLPLSSLTRKDGTFEEKSVMEGSSIIVRAERPGHWGTLAFADAGTPTEISLFSDSTMKSMLQATDPRDYGSPSTSAVVWGRIVRSGKPVSGATVDLMTTSEEIRPIYFNSMNLPDPTLTATSENGLYAFFPVTAGAHAVRAADSRGATEPILFPADVQTVSQVDLELSIDRKAKVRVFDAFKTDWPLSAEVASAGRTSGTMVDRSGETTIRFASGRGQLILDADAGRTYERVRLMVPRDRRTVDFPMVQSLWLDRLRGNLRIDRAPETGTVVGFIQGSPAYKVSLDEESIARGTRIVYFDGRGQISRNEFGENGGGFIVFNLPEGFRTLFVQPTGTSKVFAASLLVDAKVTNVLTRNLKQ
ncbi:MAG: hypothetical protein V4760_07630 [Bdellovibrionota bacterium]